MKPFAILTIKENPDGTISMKSRFNCKKDSLPHLVAKDFFRLINGEPYENFELDWEDSKSRKFYGKQKLRLVKKEND